MKNISTLIKKKYIYILLCIPTLFLFFIITSNFRIHADSPGVFTGCISANAGLFYNVKAGTSPFNPCPTGDPQVSALSSIQRYQSVGDGITNISPSSTWVDVPNASVSATFAEGKWKATYTGSLVMTNGDGTAYVRLEIRPSGGSSTDLSNVITLEHISSPSTSEAIAQPFTFQSLIDMPAGAVSIVPQVYSNNTSWSLINNSTLILEQ